MGEVMVRNPGVHAGGLGCVSATRYICFKNITLQSILHLVRVLFLITGELNHGILAEPGCSSDPNCPLGPKFLANKMPQCPLINMRYFLSKSHPAIHETQHSSARLASRAGL